MNDFDQLRRAQEEENRWHEGWAQASGFSFGLLWPVYLILAARREWKKGEPERQQRKRQKEDDERKKELHQAELRLKEEVRQYVANKPPPPPPPAPPTEEARLANALARFQSRVRALEAGGLVGIELDSAKEQARQLYLREVAEVLK